MAEFVITNYSNDKFTVTFDDDMQEVINNYRWRVNEGYVCTTTEDGGRLYLHRLVMEAKPGDPIVEHLNGNSLDCHRENLFFSTKSNNNKNYPIYNNSGTSKYRGVSWDSTTKRWTARQSVNRKKIHVGSFLSEEDAYQALVKFRVQNDLPLGY